MSSTEDHQIPLSFLDNDDVLSRIKGQYEPDSFFKLILDDPDHYCNLDEQDGYIRLHSKERTVLCIPNILIEGRSVGEHLIEQAHSVLAHLGMHKTLAYLHNHL